MSHWKSRSYFGGQSGTNNDEQDGYGAGQQYEATGGKKRASSRFKRSSKKDEDAAEDYPNYTVHNDGSHDDDADDNRYNSNGGNYHSNTSNDYGGGGNPYNGVAPYYGGRGYGNNSPYGNGGEGGYAPYNAPAAFWAPQDGTRSPMIIQTREVNVYGMPQYDNDGYNDQRRRGSSGSGGGGGFFGPAFHAVGHFFDRKFGFHDRD